MLVAQHPLGRRDAISDTVVILKEGHLMKVFRGERSKITRILSEFFFGTANSLALNLTPFVGITTPAEVTSCRKEQISLESDIRMFGRVFGIRVHDQPRPFLIRLCAHGEKAHLFWNSLRRPPTRKPSLSPMCLVFGEGRGWFKGLSFLIRGSALLILILFCSG